MPSRQAQVSLIQSAYRQGGCDPAVTGAIGEAIGAYRRSDKDGKLFVGSVKTNIGHLEGASGLAGLIKAVRSLEEGVIAPNIWFENGNPAIDFDGWHIQVPTEPTAWPASGLRRASINGFGYGGTNAHIIVDDAYHYLAENGLQGHHRTRPPPLSGAILSQLGPDRISDKAAKDRPIIFYLSAHEREAVENAAKSLSEYLVLPSFIAEGYPLENLA
ncbi:thiolase-like protein [Parachaetomium inaequale]|uniref:Thiolase-like protein n=1 Tax=Parachaetomium inaequale TaxID=2588326 RepID=A0AAN6P6P6_9PEZI|nr:thiolase-like protein [Parachaetomium inaequale]